MIQREHRAGKRPPPFAYQRHKFSQHKSRGAAPERRPRRPHRRRCASVRRCRGDRTNSYPHSGTITPGRGARTPATGAAGRTGQSIQRDKWLSPAEAYNPSRGPRPAGQPTAASAQPVEQPLPSPSSGTTQRGPLTGCLEPGDDLSHPEARRHSVRTQAAKAHSGRRRTTTVSPGHQHPDITPERPAPDSLRQNQPPPSLRHKHGQARSVRPSPPAPPSRRPHRQVKVSPDQPRQCVPARTRHSPRPTTKHYTRRPLTGCLSQPPSYELAYNRRTQRKRPSTS
jgi:hypothetical protein